MQYNPKIYTMYIPTYKIMGTIIKGQDINNNNKTGHLIANK